MRTLTDIRDEIDRLMADNREVPSAARETRLVTLRRIAGERMSRQSSLKNPHVTTFLDLFGKCAGLPEVPAAELTVETLSSGILNYGALVVRGLYSSHQVDHLMNMATERPKPLKVDGKFVKPSAREVFELIKVFEDSGMLDVAREYLGGEAVLHEGRLTLKRRIGADEPRMSGLPWHQDVNFYQQKSYALNCWTAITPCGKDNPGLGIIPKRFEESVGWDISKKAPITYGLEKLKDIVKNLEPEASEVQTIFEPGDAIFFDEMTLHRSTYQPYRIPEQIVTIAWMFRASMFPNEDAPLAI